MPRIKGWKKVGKCKWKNILKPIHIEIVKERYGHIGGMGGWSEYAIRVYNPIQTLRQNSGYIRLDDAVKDAILWMRRHPKG